MRIRVKRIYDPPAESDGCRVLIDRLWPRGIKKSDARIAHWAKDLAPSTELRRWFAHDAAKFPEFQRRYVAELAAKQQLIDELLQRAGTGTLTLLFAARDRDCNHAVVLRDYLSAP